MKNKVNVDEYLENEFVQDVIKKTVDFLNENKNMEFSVNQILSILKNRINPDFKNFKNVINTQKGVKKIMQLVKYKYPDLMIVTTKKGYYLTTNVDNKINECNEVMKHIEKKLLGNELTISRREKLVEEFYEWRDKKVFWENKKGETKNER